MTQAEAFDMLLQLIQRKIESGIPEAEQVLLWLVWNVAFFVLFACFMLLKTWPYFVCWWLCARWLRSIKTTS